MKTERNVYKDPAGRYRWWVEFDGAKYTIYSPGPYPDEKAAEDGLDSALRAIASSVLDMRPAVIGFAIEMERQLQKHDGAKGEIGWLEGSPLALFAKLMEEVGEVAGVLLQPVIPTPERVREECADVGNIAMMIADYIVGFPQD